LWRETILRKIFKLRHFLWSAKENSGHVKILFRSQPGGDNQRLIADEHVTYVRRENKQSLHIVCGILFINGKEKQGDSGKM
jgi:hypothetical protein